MDTPMLSAAADDASKLTVHMDSFEHSNQEYEFDVPWTSSQIPILILLLISNSVVIF